MRVTQSMYYKTMNSNSNNVTKGLFDVNKQISSGQKIQYAYEGTDTFINTLRLDDEVATHTQVKNSATSAFKFSTQTDTVLGDFTKTLGSFKTKLISAANVGANSDDSLDAIAKELRSMKNHLINLSNTSINGSFLFSGSATDTKPISQDGSYNGNDADLKAFFGADSNQKYNITGNQLFLGEESRIKREITTNIALKDSATGLIATEETTLGDITNNTNDQTFYLRGRNSDGSSIKERFTLSSTASIENLLQSVENAFAPDSVNVSLDKGGNIVIKDKQSGSSKLDFQLVAGESVENDIDNLVPSIEFNKSALSANSSATGSESAIYDRVFFSKDGANLSSNVSQTLSSDNSFAVDSTKLSEVFSSLSSSLDIEGKRLDGSTFNINVSLGSPASVSGDYNYNISNGDGVDTNGADVTYRQFLDVINNAINNQDPSSAPVVPPAQNSYQSAIQESNKLSEVELSADGKISFRDLNNNPTLADISIADSNSDDFSNTNGAIATFQTNNALTIRDPKTDFFARIEEAIVAVESHNAYPDGNDDNARNGGIQNAIQIIDDVSEHVFRTQSQTGAQSNAIDSQIQRTDTLIVTTQTLRSEIVDTDIADSILRLNQLSLNYQAMMSTISRVSQLSLVNYL